MPIIKCTIDRNVINKWTKHQRELGQKIILVDPSGLRPAINARSSSWNFNVRKRGVGYQGRRHPQRTLRIGDPVTMLPQQPWTTRNFKKALKERGFEEGRQPNARGFINLKFK